MLLLSTSYAAFRAWISLCSPFSLFFFLLFPELCNRNSRDVSLALAPKVGRLSGNNGTSSIPFLLLLFTLTHYLLSSPQPTLTAVSDL
ncbi:hypothetical protein F5B18DRAFT_593678 [Nemania serpens]|nr:hypothetical protein F5B18DRAFT_593678 [Nemania serpens]